MDDLIIEATTSTPRIAFRAGTGALTIEGESYPDNTVVFFTPALEWLKAYLSGGGPAVLTLNLAYMNTSSVKFMLDILEMLEETHGAGGSARVIWNYDPENERALDMALEFQEDLTLPFEILPLD